MPQITFIEHDGTRHDVEAVAGQSLMQTAVDNLVPGIIGECGGVCSCATCHVYLDSAWLASVAPISEGEDQLLDGIPDRQPEHSRLGCQLTVTENMEGMEVNLPEEQY